MSHRRRRPDPDKPELGAILRREDEILRTEREILHELHEQHHPTPTAITFTEITMNSTAAGQSQVFTGTLVPAGAVYPADSTFTVVSNDPAVSPSVDSTGLVVSVSYPAGWVESTTTPLAFSYAAASASNPNMSVSSTIPPSAPVNNLPTGITFNQTT